MARQPRTYPSLDRTGTQAAVYPSEDSLWVGGPPITDPSSQGVAIPPAPQQMSPTREEEYLHEVINGELTNQAYAEEWVNVESLGPTGFGPWNDNMAVWETGHSQNIISNPGSEQGWGVGPARRWAHYPHEESPNPTRSFGQHFRNGQLPWVSADSSLYERTQLAWEQQWEPYKVRGPVAAVVPLPPSVPFGATVPTYSGGPIAYPGVDVPIGPELGVYP